MLFLAVGEHENDSFSGGDHCVRSRSSYLTTGDTGLNSLAGSPYFFLERSAFIPFLAVCYSHQDLYVESTFELAVALRQPNEALTFTIAFSLR